MTDLKHSKEGLMEAFDHQLVYEVDMFYRTYNFLDVPAWSPGLANAIIESFCVHARNLIEFFDQESATPGQARSNYMGAKHFCDGYIPWTKGGPSNDLRGRLNRQISHLTYDRTSKEEEKIGRKERAKLVELIERELEVFGGCLRKPYVEKWPFAKRGNPGTTIWIGDFAAWCDQSSHYDQLARTGRIRGDGTSRPHARTTPEIEADIGVPSL